IDEDGAAICFQNLERIQKGDALPATELGDLIARIKVKVDLFGTLALMNFVVDGLFAIAERPHAAQVAQEVFPKESDLLIVTFGRRGDRVRIAKIFVEVNVAFTSVGIGLRFPRRSSQRVCLRERKRIIKRGGHTLLREG